MRMVTFTVYQVGKRSCESGSIEKYGYFHQWATDAKTVGNGHRIEVIPWTYGICEDEKGQIWKVDPELMVFDPIVPETWQVNLKFKQNKDT